MPIISKLQNGTRKEKAVIKSAEIKKLALEGQHSIGDYVFEIVELRAVEGRIEVFSRVTENGNQIGFGEDGTVDIERFTIVNPPILVPDASGSIKRIIPADSELGIAEIEKSFSEEPLQAILETLIHTISVMKNKHDDSKIVVGKRGNTTSTFFTDTEGDLFKDDDTDWATSQGAATGARVREGVIGHFESGTGVSGTGNVEISRSVTYYDTSSIGAADTITSATLSLYYDGAFKQNDDNDGDDYFAVVHVQGDQLSAETSLATADYDQVGDAIDDPTEGSDQIDITGISTLQYYDFTLDATGRGWVARSGESIPAGTTAGLTFLGWREGHDMLDNAFVGSSNERNRIHWESSDEAGTTKDPKLVVEHAFPGPAHRDTQTASSASTNSLDITSVDASAGTDLAIVVSIAYKDTGGGEVTGVTWDSATANESFTQVGTESKNGEANSQMWVLANPTSKTATVTIATTNAVRIVGVANVYTNTDQSSPIRGASVASANGTTGNSAPITVNVVANADEMVIDAGAQVSAGPDTISSQSGTARGSTTATGGGTDTIGMAQEIPSTGATETMSYTMSADDNWAIIAAALQKAGSAVGPATVKTLDTVALASIKTIDGIAIASVKTINTAA
jgi:hypothetical protein